MPADMNDYFKKRKPTQSNGNNNGEEPENFENPFKGMGGGKGIGALIILGIIAFLFITFKPFTIINSGEVGIKVRTGKFDETPLNPGLHFFIPVFEKIIPVNTRIRLITYSNSRNQELGDQYHHLEGGLRRNPAI
jgi:hypothetical protein